MLSIWNTLDWPDKKTTIRTFQEHIAFFALVGICAKSIQFAASFI
jgi:hypothetical protein